MTFQISSYLEDFTTIVSSFLEYQDNTIPLCAAENALSPLVRAVGGSRLHGRFIDGGVMSHDNNTNFIGSEMLFPLYKLINDLCKQLFSSRYADPRPLSGLNAATLVLMSLTSPGDKVLFTGPSTGGHSTYPTLLKRLGLCPYEIKKDAEQCTYDYEWINTRVSEDNIKAIVFCPSEILKVPDFSRICGDTLIIYDATQTIGLIAGKVLPNPFTQSSNMVVLCGADKTLCGPVCGLVMTNNEEIGNMFDETINPNYIRNSQIHQVAALAIALIEALSFGEKYSQHTVDNSLRLERLLTQMNFNICKSEGIVTETHQLVLRMPKIESQNFFMQARRNKITMNQKYSMLFDDYIIRLGVQEITRYGWGYDELTRVSRILSALRDSPEFIRIDLKEDFEDLKMRKNYFYKVLDSSIDELFLETIQSLS